MNFTLDYQENSVFPVFFPGVCFFSSKMWAIPEKTSAAWGVVDGGFQIETQLVVGTTLRLISWPVVSTFCLVLQTYGIFFDIFLF